MAFDYAERATAESIPEPVARFCAELGPDEDLLDAGCGGGDPMLATAGANGVGLDFSREQLQEAHKSVCRFYELAASRPTEF